jgi:hypothetical protein
VGVICSSLFGLALMLNHSFGNGFFLLLAALLMTSIRTTNRERWGIDTTEAEGVYLVVRPRLIFCQLMLGILRLLIGGSIS